MLLRRLPSLLTAFAGVPSIRRAAQCTASGVSSVFVEQFGALGDNYGYLVHDAMTGATAAIDTPEVKPILEALTRRGWTLTHIFNTHHHAE